MNLGSESKVPDADPNLGLREVLLQEYSASSSAIAEATKRIETIRGLYLAAAFTIIGGLLSAQPGHVDTLMEGIRSDRNLLTGVLLLPFLNSLLLIYAASTMHFILAAAQYNTYELGPRISRHTNEPVLQFDTWSSSNKDFWVFLRTISGVLYYGFATAVSLGVLLSFRVAGRFHLGIFPGLAFLVSIVVVSLGIVVGVMSFLISRGFHGSKRRGFSRRTLGWSTLGLSTLVYAALLLL